MSEQDPRPTPHPTPDPTESTAGPSVEVVEPGRRWRATLGTWSVVGFLGRLHHTHSWLVEAETEDPVQPEVLAVLADAIATESGVPMSTKATPGSAHHDRMLAAGATAYQQCPPSVVDPTTEANRAWAEAGESLPGVELEDLNGRSDEEVLANWVRQYTWVHERWSAVRDEATAREVFAPMLADELDRARSVLVRRRGEPVAEAFTFVEPDGRRRGRRRDPGPGGRRRGGPRPRRRARGAAPGRRPHPLRRARRRSSLPGGPGVDP